MFIYKDKAINLSAVVRRLREAGVTKGASVSNLSRIFAGKRQPTHEMFKALAGVFRVSLDEMDRILMGTAENARKRKEMDIWG